MTVIALYDTLAPVYDARYDTPYCQEEDDLVMSWVRYEREHAPRGVEGSVLDVGCGTGLLLDHLGHEMTDYLGIDPSAAMLSRLGEKHPAARTVQCTLEDFTAPSPLDFIVSLYGSPSYCEPEAIARIPKLLTPGGRALLMFYREGYLPDYHTEKPPTVDPSRELALRLGSWVYSWHNYEMVVFCV